MFLLLYLDIFCRKCRCCFNEPNKFWSDAKINILHAFLVLTIGLLVTCQRVKFEIT